MKCEFCNREGDVGEVRYVTQQSVTKTLCEDHFNELYERATEREGCMHCGVEAGFVINKLGERESRDETAQIWCEDHIPISDRPGSPHTS